MKQFILSILLLITALISLNASVTESAQRDTTSYSIEIIDYGQSWISTTSYKFTDSEVFIQEIDNIDNSQNKILLHRELFGMEKRKIRKYLSLFVDIEFSPEYKGEQKGARNQKRVNITYGDKSRSTFVVNFFQQDVAGFVAFLNTMLPEDRRIKELEDPNKPVAQKK